MKETSLKIIFSIFLIIFCFQSLHSQDRTKNKKTGQHTVYAEFLGNAGFWYNIGYDYTLTLNEKHKLSFACGFQYFPLFENHFPDIQPIRHFDKNYLFTGSTINFSPQINYLYGKKHHLEIGIGITFEIQIGHYYNHNVEQGWAIPFRIGYRYQKENGGLFFKIAWVPSFIKYYTWNISNFMPFWGGISIGYTFKNKK